MMMVDVGVGIVIFFVVVVSSLLVLLMFRTKKERYTWQSQGDANHYRIMDNGKWFAIVQLNGEIHHVVQEDYMDQLVEKLNHA